MNYRIHCEPSPWLSEDLEESGPPAPSTLYHVILTGQSNATGRNSLPILSSSSAQGRMFNGGLYPGGSGGNLASLVPLVEVDAGGTHGETIASAMANKLAAVFPGEPILFSLTGDDGKRYDELKKGTSYYSESIAQATAARAIADAGGLAYRILAIAIVHGEADQEFSKTDYGPHVAEWQIDYDADLGLISGQLQAIPLFISQQAGYAPDNSNGAGFTASSALLVEEAHQVTPAAVVIAAPCYPFDHGDRLHFCNHAHRLLGELFARAIERVCVASQVFHGVSPASCSLSGAVVTINFFVPTPPLVWDFSRVLFQPGNGFAFDDSTHSAAVAAVSITGPAQVQVTLSAVPTGTNPQIRYACDTFQDDFPKFGNGKGNLRDSETGSSLVGEQLFNFCLCFRRFL